MTIGKKNTHNEKLHILKSKMNENCAISKGKRFKRQTKKQKKYKMSKIEMIGRCVYVCICVKLQVLFIRH